MEYLRQKNDERGFTLMETLIAISVFIVISTVSLSIYMATLRASQRTKAMTRVQSEAQLIMSVLAKKVRNSEVKYSHYGELSVNVPVEELALVDEYGTEYVFAYDQDNSRLTVNSIPIPTSRVEVTNVKYYISPATDPETLITSFEQGAVDNLPLPYVTLVMTVSSTVAGETSSLVVQQTIPQRIIFQ